MSRDPSEKIEVTNGWLEVRLVESMYAHRAAALEDLEKEVRSLSGEAWSAGGARNSVIATYLRDELAPRLKVNAALERKKQDETRALMDGLKLRSEVEHG